MTKTKKAPEKGASDEKMNEVLRRMLATPPRPTVAPKPKTSGPAKRGQRKKSV